jgi:hypothetical protein
MTRKRWRDSGIFIQIEVEEAGWRLALIILSGALFFHFVELGDPRQHITG